MCMTLKVMFLSTIIPYPYNLGDNIDICLQPLINELKQLWSSGALTYDVDYYQISFFNIINDFYQ